MRNPNCKDCPLHRSARTVCLWGEGPKQAEVMVIGEAPGSREDGFGRPFMGDSGRLLRTELIKAGFDPEAIYFTSVVKCRTPDNRDPKPEELKACRKYLDAEIAAVKPKYIITAGRFSSKTVLKKSKITQDHGQIVSAHGVIGMPVYHPAYCLRDPSKTPGLAYDLKRLCKEIDGELDLEDEFRYKVVRSGADLDQFFRELDEADAFAHDTETSGLFPHDRKGAVRCLGIGLPKRAWVIPLEMPGSSLAGKSDLQKALVSEIRRRGKWVVAQNGKFDNHWEHYYLGGALGCDFDTMLAHHVLDENQDHDLKYMARVELDCPEYDISTKDKKGGSLHIEAKREEYLQYCARDAWNTLKLSEIFKRRLVRDLRLRRLFFQLVMPASRAIERAERRGLQLDEKRYAEVEAQTKDQLSETLRELNKLAGRKVNWNSPAQVGKLLYEDLRLPCTVRTGKGAPSTGEAALIELKGKHPIIENLVHYRELERFQSTYLEGWKEYTVDGKLYVSYKIHGTVTGRYSSRLHSIPRDGIIRNLGTAPAGWSFVQADLSQAELRIAAELSGDLELISCFRPGGQDVHWRTLLYMIASGKAAEYTEQTKETAEQIAMMRRIKGRRPSLSDCLEILTQAGHERCISVWKGWKEARKKAKAINFGFIYGMYEKKFIENAKLKYDWDCTWEEAHDFRQAYFELYSGIPAWHDRCKRLVRVDGFVTNLFGRRRRLPGIYSSDKLLRMECERQAINSPVQGTIGDWKAAAFIEIDQTIDTEKFQLVGEHHDAILGQVRNGCEDEVLPQIRRIMRRPKLLDTFKINPRVPMEAEIEVGNWGAGKKYEADLK